MSYYNNTFEYESTPLSENDKLNINTTVNDYSFFHSYREGRYATRKDYSFSVSTMFRTEETPSVYNCTQSSDPGKFTDIQYNVMVLCDYHNNATPWGSWLSETSLSNTALMTTYRGANYYGWDTGTAPETSTLPNEALRYSYRITNWVYDAVAIAPKIYGVIRNYNTTNSIFTETQGYYLKQFFDSPSLIQDDNLVGYNIKYDVVGYNESSSPFISISMPVIFAGFPHIVNLTNTNLHWYTLGGSFIMPTNIIAGGLNNVYNRNWSNFWGTVTNSTMGIGNETIEGLTLLVAHQNDYLFNNNGTNYNTRAREYYVARDFYYNWTLEDIVQMSLSLGLPVLASSEAANFFYSDRSIQHCVESNNNLVYDYTYMPKIANGRIDREEFYKGKDIENAEIYQKALLQKEKQITDDDFMPISDVIGTVPSSTEDIDNNTYVEEIPLNSPTVTPVGIFSRWYALTEYDVNDLFNFLYVDRDTSQFTQIIEGLALNGENPMDFIISLRMYPFPLNDYLDLNSNQEIGFGNGVNTGVIAEKINFASVVLDCGKVKFPKYHKNFLDYSPYTDAKLYIPYCGEVSIDTSVYVGSEISVKIIVDITTGMCCAVIYRNGIPAMYKDGHIAMDIQLTGSDSYSLATSYISNLTGMANGAITSSVGAKMSSTGFISTTDTMSTQVNKNSGNINISEGLAGTTSRTSSPLKGNLQAFGGIGEMVSNAWEWYNTPTPLQISGSNSPLTELFKPQFCYLIIQQSIPINIENYGNSYGYACMEYRAINSFSDGDLIVCKNCNITPPTATLPEISEIKQLLESGVWK